MNISKPFIARPVFTTLIMVTLVAFGVLAYKALPVSSLPQLEYPTIQVTTSYPGASPEDMAVLVSSPLERQFMLMQGIQFVSSANTYENSSIVLQFHLDVNIDVAAQETEEAIQQALAQLPTNLPQNPIYTKFNPSDTPIIYAIVYSPVQNPWSLYEYGYNFLGQQVGTIEGVANIQTYGFPYAVRVRLDPEALASRNITLAEVADVINNENTIQPTGKFYSSSTSIVNSVQGQLLDAKDYEPIIIKYIDGAPVRLSDLGTVEDGLQNDKQQFSWITKDVPKGQAAMVLAIFRQLGYNTVQICNDIEALFDRLLPQIPRSIKVAVPFSLSVWIEQAVNDVEFTLILAFILVILVVYFYLGRIKNSLIPLITLPITITGTFIFMQLLGYSLDIMSLSALTLAIGFLVDDAIVVLENIVRWGQMEGLSPYQAALRGAKQISLCVIAISLSLSAVFVPMLFLTGPIGEIFHEFAGVIITAVLFSGFISLSLTPMLCSRFINFSEEEKKTKMERFALWLNDKLLNKYEPLLHSALRHRAWVLSAAVASILITGILLFKMPQEFMPPTDLGAIQGFAQAAEGTSPEKIKAYMEEVVALSINNPYVDNMALMSASPTDSQALFFYNLVDRSKRPDIWTVIKGIQEETSSIMGVQLFLKPYPLINLQVGSTQSGKADYQYVMQSFDTESLYSSATKLMAAMKSSGKFSTVTSDMQINAPILRTELLRDQSHAYGNINATNIENAFGYAYGETYISKINKPENMYYVILELEKPFLQDPSNLSELYLANMPEDPNNQVFINSVIDSKLVSGPEAVNHLNTLTSVTVVFNQKEGVPLSDSLIEIKSLADEIFPPTVMGTVVGNTAAFEKTMAQFMSLTFISLFIVYIILGILYENFLHPLTALSAAPVAILGGLLSLILCGEILSVYAMIGLIMLLGLVMKNGILIIDFTLEMMEDEKLSPLEAVTKACIIRFRPIVMTTIAAMAGALPIALGVGGAVSEGRAPLGIAVVGGLIFAQAVTLFVIPVVFLYMGDLQAYLVRRFELFKVHPTD